MYKCVVPGCPANTSSDSYIKENKIHLFKIPSDYNKRRLWKESIRLPSDFQFNSRHRVCHKHFSKSDIKHKLVLKSPEGIILGISPYKCALLNKDAVPRFISGHEASEDDQSEGSKEDLEEMSINKKFNKPIRVYSAPKRNQITKNRFPLSLPLNVDDDDDDQEQMSPLECEDDPKLIQITKNCFPLPLPINVDDDDDDDQEQMPLECEDYITSDYFSFTDVANGHFSLPAFWTKHTLPFEKEYVVIFSLIEVIKLKGELKTFFQKEIIIQPEMQFQVNILGKCINTSEMFEFDKILSKSNLEELIQTVSSLYICRGCTLSVSEKPDLTYMDPSNTLRHKMCLLATDQDQCSFCKNIDTEEI